jgi:putative hydrolase of the HAD superfamily
MGMSMNLPQAIIFDLDDTIIDDWSGTLPCWEQTCREAESRIDGLDAAALLAAIERERDWFWSDRARHREGRLDLRAASTRIVEEALRSMGLGWPGLGAEIANRYRDLRENRLCLFPGAVETLEWFSGKGVRLGMATNGNGASQRAKIERFGLAPYFERIIIEGEFGFGKPEREVYETLFAALGAEPAKTWSVGDNLEFDVAGPQSFGAYGIWVDRAGGRLPEDSVVQPDRIIGSIQELIQA